MTCVRKLIHIESQPEGVNLSGVWENCMLEVKEGGWVGWWLLCGRADGAGILKESSIFDLGSFTPCMCTLLQSCIQTSSRGDVHQVSCTFVVLLAVEVFRRREGGCEGFLKELAAVLYREGIMRPGVGTHTVCYTCGYHIRLQDYYSYIWSP